MSIAAFSAQRFYQVATGSPVEPSHTHVLLQTEIPNKGLHLIDAAPDGTTHLAWLQGVIAPSKQRERFISDVLLRKLPHPIAHRTHSAAVRQAHYLSLNDLQSHNRTLASLLDVTETLTNAAAQSRAAQCPTCGHVIPIFLSASELCEEIVKTFSGKEIDVDLAGPLETIATWAAEHGFTSQPQDGNLATVRLDSFHCDEARTLQLQPLLASTRRLGGTWLSVNNTAEHTEYAWDGRCSTCDYQMRPFRKSIARTFIERGATDDALVEASRILEGRTLENILSASFGELIRDTAIAHTLTTSQRDAIETLGLTELSLGSISSTLTPSTLARVALVISSSLPTGDHSVVLFDAPRSLFRAQEYDAALAVAQSIARNSPVVWISSPVNPKQPSAPTREHAPKATLLGTITLHGLSTSSPDVHCGDWISIDIPGDQRHERRGLALYRALQGNSSPRVSFAPQHSLSPSFIPLFSEDSTATRLVAHQLGAIDPLAKMFAASHQAKMLGLTPRDFMIGQLKPSSTVCGTCRGTGLLHAIDGDLWREEVAPCPSCWGTRFRSPARDVTFKGKTLWEILNTSITSSEQILRALPRMKDVFELTTLLGLGEIALGTPTALLHSSHRRMLAIAHALLEATATKPSVIVVEAPFVGLNAEQQAGLHQVITHPRFKERVAWIGVAG